MGRYGNDHLGNFIIILSFIFGIVTFFTFGVADAIFSLLQIIFLVVWAMRAFSRNIYARRRENQVFLRFWNPVKKYFKGVSSAFARFKDRKHRYFKCPNCKSRLRVPRGRGEITITCPRCRHKFDKKS